MVEHLKKICEEIKENNPKTRIADDVTIVLDTPFLKFVPLLRRCGFETWDHRDASPNPAKTARQMSKEMEYFLRNLKEPTSLNTFILTNKKTVNPIYLETLSYNLYIIKFPARGVSFWV